MLNECHLPDPETDTKLASERPPLIIDLDGTLIRSDLLLESFFGLVCLKKFAPLRILREACKGRLALKSFLAEQCALRYDRLPYDQEILELAAQARAERRPVYLATASHEIHARAISEHLGLFDGVLASGDVNLKGKEKAARLVGLFGSGGFDYVGDSWEDLAVWAHARKAYTIRASRALQQKVSTVCEESNHRGTRWPSLRVWASAMRVHQYAKNILLLIPVITAHQFTTASLATAVGAAIAFSLCASAVYLMNDLIDLEADRSHPRKRKRPFASGDLPIKAGVALVPMLILSSATLAAFINWQFAAALAGYFVLTSAYSAWLKTKMMVDVVVLASLYTIRIIAGGLATGIVVSEWLLAFSMLIFTSLALMKRYVELGTVAENHLPDPSNRNYKVGDLPIVAALAAASALNSVTIFALYLSSPIVQAAYSRPMALWLICPILMYWLSRALMMAHRLSMHDDPIVFALKDRVSRLAAFCTLALILFAI